MTQILMTTYNSARFLEVQLDSILALDNYPQISLLIKDDSSTDETMKILRQYSADYGFSCYQTPNMGVNRSFFNLLQHADPAADYYAFSDSDDVWLPHKISRAAAALGKEDDTMPLLYTHCSRLVDEELHPIGSLPQPKIAISFNNALVQNIFPGHTMVFNRALLKLILRLNPDTFNMYDWAAYITAAAFGKVIYDPTISVLYRQHNANATGFELNPFALFLKRLRRMLGANRNAVAIQAKGIYDAFRDELPPEMRSELEGFLQCERGITGRLRFACDTRLHRQTALETLEFKVLFVMGKYEI